MSKYCASCGAKLDDDALFCGKCGKKIEKLVEETESFNNVVKEERKTAEKRENMSVNLNDTDFNKKTKSSKDKIIISSLIAVIVGLLFYVVSIVSSNTSDVKPKVEENSSSIGSIQLNEGKISENLNEVQSSVEDVSVDTSSKQQNTDNISVSSSSANTSSDVVSSNKSDDYSSSSKPDISRPDYSEGGEEKEDEKVPHTHSYGSWTDDGNGLTHSKTCSCGEKESEEHLFDSGKVTKEPTETDTGIKTFTCTACGATKSEIIDKLEHKHSYGSWTDDGNGSTHSKLCSCGDKITESHNWTWWEYSDTMQYRVCIECNAKETKEHVHDIVYDETQPIYKWKCRICGMTWAFDPSNFKRVMIK